jgi:hypothetical protein
MVRFYERLYYCFYRMLLWLADSYEMAPDIPRTNAVVILSLLICIQLISVLGVVTALFHKAIIIGSKISTVSLALLVVMAVFLLVFYRKRYQEIETRFSVKWEKEKTFNKLITMGYVILTPVVLFLTIYYLKNHPIKN